MLTTTGFSCCIVDAKQHTKVLCSAERTLEDPRWRMASAWLGNEPADSLLEPPMTVGIYVGRDAIQHSSWASPLSSDCMVHVYRDGVPLLSAHPLSSLENAPIILPPAGTRDRYHRHRNYISNGGPAERWAGSAEKTLSQIEVIITSPWTAPIPLLHPEQYPLSNHLAYFRFSSLPTQLINVSGVAILPKDFWIHEREISATWEPLTRKPTRSNTPSSHTERSPITLGASWTGYPQTTEAPTSYRRW
ncbi:hypothetical protein HYPSUDRAFT_855103 [Hypholoma sublateritium FD-334 SS-4]|uniref:Uncharacterized protein n=1 Tax=Hypholoma sublateritium (strain FD-334 SS-4) TaxID=945553 RepID=A0A0D2PIA6_HYPSF|nr:hypothetical protein HYPSUDRAFT_855103 [Hypholoma sublateritium FD-334 SS-4]